MSADSGGYERFIQRVRICTAIAFAVSGIGLVICANLRLEVPAALFGTVAFACLVIVVLLIAEQLFAAWIATRCSRFSLAALLLLTAAAGVFFAIARASIGLALLLLALAITVISAALEKKRHTPRSLPDDAPKSPFAPADMLAGPFSGSTATTAVVKESATPWLTED
jgi:hypothetical protein